MCSTQGNEVRLTRAGVREGRKAGRRARIAIDPYDLIRGKRLLGSWGGYTTLDRDIPKYAAEFLSGRLPLASMNTRDYPHADINKALEDVEAGRVGRPLINMAIRFGG